jgi:3-oxoacyl-[acyl-carrier-protein] synthase-3
MTDVFVDHLTYALGEEQHSVEDSVAAGRTISAPDVLREAGFRLHHLCPARETAYDLARKSVAAIGADLTGVGAVVYATCIPVNGSIGDPERFQQTKDVKHLMDFPASHLQADFGLDGAMIIGLNQQACTGMLGSLRLARMLLVAEPEVRKVLCLTADRFPPGALYEQAYNLISDGGAACLVSTKPEGFRLIAWHSITNGALACASDDETVGTFFNYTHRLIQETLAKARLQMADIRWVVPQNMNVKAWQILSRLLQVDLDRVFFGTIGEVAHVVSGDNIINLKRLSDEGRIQRGDRILLCMAGYGLNWQCVILEKS